MRVLSFAILFIIGFFSAISSATPPTSGVNGVPRQRTANIYVRVECQDTTDFPFDMKLKVNDFQTTVSGLCTKEQPKGVYNYRCVVPVNPLGELNQLSLWFRASGQAWDHASVEDRHRKTPLPYGELAAQVQESSNPPGRVQVAYRDEDFWQDQETWSQTIEAYYKIPWPGASESWNNAFPPGVSTDNSACRF